MQELRLKSLSIEGFKSFRKREVIHFPSAPGLRFITGSNLVEPSLGANGAGKSAMWGALVWCLYNTTTNRKKASDVTSWDKKQITVESVWEDPATGDQAAIKRTSAPNRLYIDGAPAEQSDVDAIIGLTFDRFVQSVIFGQGAQTFYDMDNAGRAALLDEVLDIKLWLEASELAGDEAKKLERVLVQKNTELANLEGQFAGMEPESTFEKLVADWHKEQEKQSNEVLAEIADCETELAAQSVVVQEKTSAHESIKAKHKNELEEIDNLKKAVLDAEKDELIAVGGLSAQINSIKSELRKHSPGGPCPTCGKPMDSNMQESHLQELNAKLKSLLAQHDAANVERGKFEKELLSLSLQWTKLQKECESFEWPLREAKLKETALAQKLDALLAKAERFAGPKENPHVQSLIDHRAKTANLKQKIRDLTAQLVAVRSQHDSLVYWQKAFKKLRLWLVQRVLGVMELEVNGAASSLGLPDWKIKLTTEAATKTGGTKAGIHIQVSSLHTPGVWADQSGGEEQRVRLAVALGFAAVVQRMAGIWHTLEVWDEPSNWLSEAGIEDLLTCLAHRADTLRKNVWVVDHRTLGSGAFVEAWSIVKTAEGSTVQIISPEG